MKQVIVELSEYDPEWPSMFELEKKFLMDVIDKWLCGTVEHIGSTSVPGMVAKPVVDIMFGVGSLEESKSAIDLLVRSGYEYFPYKEDVMHWFCKPSDAFRTHHLHLVPYQSQLWNERIKFRNLLLSNQKIAKQYSDLKQELAARYRGEREVYTQKKGPFIQRVLENESLCN